MIVKYSSLNRMETPKFTLCNPGSVYKNGLLSKVIGTLIDTEAEEIVFNFNATSECNFRVNQIAREDNEDNAHTDYLYKSIQNRRLIFVEDIGYFMITGVDDGYDGGMHYKDIKAQSIDVEIAQKMLPSIPDGTYRFQTDATNGNKGILETIVETLPLWTIGEVDETVAEKWRTFEDVDTSLNCLSFLLQNIQDAYECIVVFDIIERTISVYAQDNYVRQTDIHITKDDLINSLEISENADDLYTAISVIGDDNITISAINPLGTNVIYDFSYYIDWMSADLGAKVVAWQNAVEEEREPYYDLNLKYYNKMSEKSELQAEIGRLDTQITTYTRCRENIVATSSTNAVSGYNEVIAESGGTEIDIGKEIADTLAQIDNLVTQCNNQKASVTVKLAPIQKELDTYKEQIEQAHKELSITTYFTDAEYTELCHYIFEGSYTDEYVIITDIMTYDEKFGQMKTLYDRAVSQLERVSKPTQEFSVDVENFIFIKDFEKWSEQLETGCLINVELGVNDIALLFLSNITINYDDHSLNMTFGNRFNKFDPKSLFNDVLGKISKSANTLGYIKNLVYPIKSGEFSEMQEALQTSRDLTMRAALASTNEEVVIDNTGYTGRRILDSGEYDPRQVKLVCNSLVFTDDEWDSCKTAIGEILLGDGDSVYGINADAVMGRVILGENLAIGNESGNLTFDNDGFVITNGKNSFAVNPNNANSLLSIMKGQEKVLYVDENGKLYIKGDGSGLDISTNDSITQVVSRTQHYGTCISGSIVQAKVVKLDDNDTFKLYKGASISVKFDYKNAIDSPTLNVNNTGAKPIYAYGSTLTANSAYNWSAGSVVSFVYDGEHWVISDSGSLHSYSQIKQTADSITSRVGETETNVDGLTNRVSTVEQTADSITSRVESVEGRTQHYGTCTSGSIVQAKVVKLDDNVPFELYKGSSVSVNFDYGNVVASPTLNVGGTGAKPIYAYGSSLTADSAYNWSAGAVVSFVYDGEHWVISDSGSLYSYSQIMQTADAITLRVGKTETDVDGLTNRVSTIEQTADSITSRVESVEGAAQHYGICNSVEDNAEKYVALDNFTLYTGATVSVWFRWANKIAAPKMSVNGTGFKEIRTPDGTALTADSSYNWSAQSIVTFDYDGTNWVISDSGSLSYAYSQIKQTADAITSEVARATDAEGALSSQIKQTADEISLTVESRSQHYGTCATAAGTAAKAVTCEGFAEYTGAAISVKFTHKNTAASPTLNVNGEGAKQIRAYGSALTADSSYNWSAGAVVSFVYDGTYWVMSDSGALYQTSQIKQTADEISLTVSKKVGSDEIISKINQTPETISIDAEKINLNGAITANGTFKIKTDGNMEATGGKIGGWTITTSKISAGNGSENNRVACVQVPSENTHFVFAAGGTTHTTYEDCPFRVTKAGKLYATDADIEGDITANTITANTSGEIAGWDLSSYKLSKGTFGTNNYVGIYSKFPAGSDGNLDENGSAGSTHAKIGGVLSDSWRIIAGNKFGVTKDGTLAASNVSIEGSIVATTGQIGDWHISNGQIYGETGRGGYVYLTPVGVTGHFKRSDGSEAEATIHWDAILTAGANISDLLERVKALEGA